MSSITKKQTVVALVAIAFASAMILGTIAAASDQSAFASHHKHQKISQKNKHSSSVRCESNGGSAISTGNGALGLGISVAGNGGTNVCFDNNPQTNANTGNNDIDGS